MPYPRRTLLLIVLAAGFAVAHTQSPLFYQNQNQYLLHGLAAAGYGHLDHDWLANTKDPTPVFSGLVAGLYMLGGLFAIQVAYFVLLMGYFLAMWWLVRTSVNAGRTGLLGFAALLTLAHAALPRWLSVQLTGVDYPWYLQSGVAGQYILGPGLQPSAFGVLLVAGLAAFANGRPVLAGLFGAIGAVVHPTYLLPAGLLTTGYLVALWRQGRRRMAACVGAVSLAVVAPVIVYTLMVFPPTSREAFATAQHLLAVVRIPHHASVAKWFDGVAAAQVGWVAMGIILARNTRLFWPLLVAAVGSITLTLVQLATGTDTLALLFPWRISAVLVPVSTAVIIARLLGVIPVSRAAAWTFGVLFVCVVASGVAVTALGLGYRMNEAEVPALVYVRDHAGPDDVYLIPVRVPAVGSGPRGSGSNTFTPPPKPNSNLIPIDLQRFRLFTGARLFVDFKSVPYADMEVLEWHRRLRLAEAWYKEKDWDAAGIRGQLLAEGITHVLVPRRPSIRAEFLGEPVYDDDAYAVYRVR